MKKLIFLEMFIAIFAVIGLCYGTYYFLYKTRDSYVVIDINPSVEFIVNKVGLVIEVNPLNNDGNLLISDINLIDMNAEEASEIIIKEATNMGYISIENEENLIVVTAYKDGNQINEELQKRIATKINNHFKNKDIQVKIKSHGITNELKNKANELGITYGKMLYIKKALEVNPDLKIEDLSNMSMLEINKEMKKVIKTFEEKAGLKELKKEIIKEKNQEKIESSDQSTSNNKNNSNQNSSGSNGQDNAEN